MILVFTIPVIDSKVSNNSYINIVFKSLLLGFTASYFRSFGLTVALNEFWYFPDFFAPFTGIIIGLMNSIIFSFYFLLLYLYSKRIVPLLFVLGSLFIIQKLNLNFMPYSFIELVVDFKITQPVISAYKSYGTEFLFLILIADSVSLVFKFHKEFLFKIIFTLSCLLVLFIPYPKKDLDKVLNIGFVQPNSSDKHWGSETSKINMLNYANNLVKENIDLIVFPESSFSQIQIKLSSKDEVIALLNEEFKDFLLFSKLNRVNLIFTVLIDFQKSIFNSVVFINSQGEIQLLKPKLKTFPFFEAYTNKEKFDSFIDYLNFRNLYSENIEINNITFLPLICYEAIFYYEVDNIDLLVELKNNYYFRHTKAISLHQRLAKLRSMENQNSILSIDNIGFSTFYNLSTNSSHSFPASEGSFKVSVNNLKNRKSNIIIWFVILFLVVLDIYFFIEKFKVKYRITFKDEQ